MDHEETLLTFVNTAGPDTDLGFARALLEMHDWNLEAALNEVLAIPPETHHEQVRAPMRTNYHEQLIPQAADDDLAMAVQASLQHHDPFQPQMPPAFQGEDELQHAMERSFTDHMEQAIKISKLDNDYDEAVRMSKDPHRMTASRQGDRRRDGPVSQPIPDDSPAPDSSGTFAQVSNPFGRSSLPSSSAAAPTPIRAPALQAPPRQPPRPAAKLFGGQTYSSKASAAAASSSSQGGGQTSVPTAPSRPQLQPRLQQAQVPSNKRRPAAEPASKMPGTHRPISASSRGVLTPPATLRAPIISAPRLTGTTDSSGAAYPRTTASNAPSRPHLIKQRAEIPRAAPVANRNAEPVGAMPATSTRAPLSEESTCHSNNPPRVVEDAGRGWTSARAAPIVDDPPSRFIAKSAHKVPKPKSPTRASPHQISPPKKSVASHKQKKLGQHRSVLSAVAEDLMQPNGSSVVSNDVCGGHIQGALREEKWLQELEAEQRRKREELHQQKQEEERQRELHLEQQRNAALARASDAPRVPGSSAPPVINVPEVAAFSAMSTADKDKEKEKERETKARQCLQSMKKLPADQLQAAMKTLHAYISNLAKNPMDEKFHRINMENKNFASTVAPHEDAIALLMLCGFQKEGVFLVMDQAFIKSKGSFLWSVLSKVDVLRR
eukprot:GEMP01013249.1.p1 GENE.GEMP01013249.1~~GEMP01013249.1.p1  ORF type:complete len:663 (+),score=158.27 GEMP01013249.1:81-2069(+)